MTRRVFRLSDSVSLRLIQIFQEAIMTGVDGADLLRMVRVEASDDDDSALVLTPEYKLSVEESFKKQLERAEQLRAGIHANPFDDDGDSGDSN